MVGIYKIVSPSGKIYIGQSVDIEKRFNRYYRLECKSQSRLYNSLLKYGIDKHILSIVVECDKSELNEYERKYQDYYNVIGENGLNCYLTKTNHKSGFMSKESKDRISISKKGTPSWNKGLKNIYTEETLLKMSISKKGKPSHNKGIIRTEEQKMAQSNRLIGKNGKLIVDTQTGIFYYTTGEAASVYNINRATLIGYLSGKRPNKTNLIYC